MLAPWSRPEGCHVDRTYFQNERSEIRPLVPAARRHILEIGCGEGRFAASLDGAQEIWGIEPDQAAANTAATRLTRVFPTDFNAARESLPTAFFDVVICNDVIEHMDDHDLFLQQIQPHLAPGGVIIGSVPNVRYYRNLFDLLVLGDWHYQNAGVLDRTHKRFFTLKSLRRSLRENGLTVQAVHGINAKLTPDFSAGQARYTIFGYLVLALSLGFWRDIAYMQIAFRAAK
jgi:2-polyprenyl-3-methyl-5-hydroxy-6-metoxy-1,4-benzoquinol methylase